MDKIFVYKDEDKRDVKDVDPEHKGHHYLLSFPDTENNFTRYCEIYFQNGDPKTVGINGITNECLIYLLIDRLKALNEQQHCIQNQLAAIKLSEALVWLNDRSTERLQHDTDWIKVKDLTPDQNVPLLIKLRNGEVHEAVFTKVSPEPFLLLEFVTQDKKYSLWEVAYFKYKTEAA